MNFIKVFVALSLVALACADLYMQNPKGSNNRLDESNTNRNNANRLFDSQNNGKGGYCWAPSMSFYQGSELSIEWTNQHACGNEMVGCHVVIQFMCSPDDADPQNLVRDGSVIGDGANTDRIPFDTDDASNGPTETVTGSTELKYGLHETWMNYKACTTRLRNNGLFTADRNVGNPSNSPARRTRQNNNGNRHGYECPEERDYYPYWHPSKRIDIAYLTGTPDKDCGFIRSESHNVKDQWECMTAAGMPAQPNNEADCLADEDNEGNQWVKTEKNGFPGPDCAKAPWSRLNHLGNGRNGFANTYNWTIPRVRGRVKCAQGGNDCGFNCVLRMRYNISQADTGSYSVKEGFLDSNFNGDDSPIKNDNIQYQDGLGHQLAMDTSQFARTFQDRSHVFKVLDRPGFLVDTDRIQNLNVRGKRGNIVQTYPATEYDFVPQHLGVRKNDYIHFQWTGCDTNPQGNAGEGTAKTDRSNIVQLSDLDKGSVATDEWLESNAKLFPDRETRMMFAYAGQPYDNPEVCHSYERLREDNNNNNNNIEQDENNCMKLNAANQYFNGGLIKMNNTGTHFIMSSRNNNFTNRGQKGTIYIADILPLWAIIVVAVFGAVFVVSGALFGAMMYARHNEHSQVAQLLNKF